MAELNDKGYDSNPFTLSFNALGRFFNSNAGWAIAIIIVGVIGFLFNMGSNLAQLATESSNTNTPSTTSNISNPDTAVIAAIVIFATVTILIFVVIWTVVYTYIQGMFAYVALQSEQEKGVDFKEAFTAVSKRFWRLLLAYVLADLKILGWTLLFIVPGIIAALKYSMLPYVIMAEPETEKGIKDAHDKTKILSKGRLIEVFGVSTVGAIIPIIGGLVDLSGKAALYNQLSYYNQHALEKPKVHWLNYIGLILLALLLLLIGFIVVIAVLIAMSNK